jgi:hypothetical protein
LLPEVGGAGQADSWIAKPDRTADGIARFRPRGFIRNARIGVS